MSTNNLNNLDAKEKIKSIVDNVNFAMMETKLNSKPSHIIPMSTKKVDDNGKIWFLSSSESEHNTNIEKDNDIQLIYSNPSSMEFMSLYGTASITRDQKIIDELYSKVDDTWFENKHDPRITAISFNPIDGQYWDSEHGALVSLFKMGIGLLTGKQQKLGTTGSLSV